MRPFSQPAPGKGLLEYAMPFAIFALTVLLIGYTADLPGQFGKNHADSPATGSRRAGGIRVLPYTDVTVGSELSVELREDPDVQILSVGAVEISLVSGETLTIRDFPIDLARLAETDGAAKTTERLLATLEDLTAALARQGALDPAGREALQALLKQGRRMVRIEKVLEEAVRRASSARAFQDQRFRFEGREETLQTLSAVLGFRNPARRLGDADAFSRAVFSGALDPNREAAVFLQDFKAAQRQGIFRDPSVERFVRHVTVQVLSLSEGVKTAIHGIASGKAPPSRYDSSLSQVLRQLDPCRQERPPQTALCP